MEEKKEAEVFTDEELLKYDGVTEATLENLSNNKGEE